jgi:hypothetical protein
MGRIGRDALDPQMREKPVEACLKIIANPLQDLIEHHRLHSARRLRPTMDDRGARREGKAGR